MASEDQIRITCAAIVEQFAKDYVSKWIGTQGDHAKAEGWAILQAAAHLREAGGFSTEPTGAPK